MNDRFYITGGTLPLNAISYVTRQADKDLLDGLRRGEFCYVLNTRQMGKSSLMVRAANHLKAEGCRVAILDLTAVGKNLTVEQWYFGLLTRVATQIHNNADLIAFWKNNRELGPMQRFVEGLCLLLQEKDLVEERGNEGSERRAVTGGRRQWTSSFMLPSSALPPASLPLPPPLVVFVDEIDAVLSLPFSVDEFFAGIRECYNRRVQAPVFTRLTFCLLGVAVPADLIRDTRTTPFNIGTRIELHDFTPQEALPLATGIACPNAKSLVERAFYWTNGHPFLTQSLCAEIAQDSSIQAPAHVDRLVAAMFFEAKARERDVNLADVSNRVLSSYLDSDHREEHRAAILDLYRQVWNRRPRVVDDETKRLIAVLKLSGITRSARGELQVRNRIYERVFDRAWVAQSMPDAELRRQKQAFKAGMLRSSAIATCIVAVMTILAVYAFSERGKAVRNEELVKGKVKEARTAQAKADESAYKNAELIKQRDADLREVREQKKRADKQTLLAKTHEQTAKRQTQLARQQKDRADLASLNAKKEAQRAKFAEQTALREAQHSSHLFYEATLGHIQSEWESNNGPKVAELLAQVKDHPDRGIEWDYWQQRSRSVAQQMIRELKGHTDQIWGLAVSTDGKWIASGSYDHTVRIWNIRTGQTEHMLTGFPSELDGVAFSPDSAQLATLTYGSGEVSLWDVHTGSSVRVIHPRTRGVCPAIVFSPDGASIAAVNGSAVDIWDVQSGALRIEVVEPSHLAIWRLAFTPDGRRLITCFENTVHIRDVHTGALIKELTAHTDSVTALAVSADGKRMATGSRNSELILWDAETFQELRRFKGHTAEITGAAFSPDGLRLATGSRDHSARLWDVQTGEALAVLKGHTADVRAVAFTPDGEHLVTASGDKTVKVWDVHPDNDVRVLRTGYANPASVQFVSYDGAHLVTQKLGYADIQDWSVLAGQKLGTLAQAPVPLIYSPDGALVARAEEGLVAVWELATGKRRFAYRREETVRLVFSRDSRYLPVAELSGTIHNYDTLTGKEAPVTSYPLDKGELLALSPDGKFYLTLDQGNGTVLLVREVGTGKIRLTLRGHAGHINAAVYTPDGRRILTASDDQTAKIWNADTGHEMATLKGHTSDVEAVAVSANGRLIATTSLDGTVRVWLTEPHPKATTLLHEREKGGADLRLAEDLRREVERLNALSIKKAEPLSAYPPERENSLRSRLDSRRTTIHFRNGTDSPLKLYWIDVDGKRVLYEILAPHSVKEQQTWVFHVWLITDPANKPLALYIAKPWPGVANIGTGPNGAQAHSLPKTARSSLQTVDGTIVLQAPTATVVGTGAKLEHPGAQPNIGWWDNPKELVQWTFAVTRPGVFTLKANYACAAGAGSDYTLKIGNEAVRIHASGTGGFGQYKEMELGRVRLDRPGTYTLTIQPDATGWQPINLTDVTLKPVK